MSMGDTAFRSEEKTGLLVALILHLALFVGLCGIIKEKNGKKMGR